MLSLLTSQMRTTLILQLQNNFFISREDEKVRAEQ